MVYVALLRGINVGGNKKIDMKLLKKAVEQTGMDSVTTYINTGNIMFVSKHIHSKADISHILEGAIQENFGLQIKVLVRSLDDIRQVIAALPENWTNDQQMRSEVLFLWDGLDDEAVLEQLGAKPGIDTVKYAPGAILWSIDKKNVNKSALRQLIGSKIYQQMTIRNVNTARKIYELMQKVEQDWKNGGLP